MGDKKANALEHEAELLLEKERLEELKDWYLDTLHGKWKYVVFVVRRSYILALIMEQITGCKMAENEDVSFMTDAAFLLCCEEMAEYYRRYGHFPSAVLCDDLLIHGRNINNIILDMERRLCQLLPEENKDTIKAALAVAVDIHVYVRADTKLLLEPRYWLKLHYTHLESALIWRKLANDLSVLIFRSNIANAAYVYSEFISTEEFEKIERSGEYRRIVYQNNTEYVKVHFSCIGEIVKAICTLRIIEDRYGNGYRVIPFVFLPNLDGEETQMLFRKICHRFERLEYAPSFSEMLKDLYGLSGMRSFNEWITMMLSNVLLQEFNSRFHINITKTDREDEIEKLARNYRYVDLQKTKNYLKQCINMPLYASTNEMEKALFLNSTYGRFIMETNGQKTRRINAWQIRKRVENYFYERGKEEEKAALRFDAYFDSRKSVAGRRARGSCFVIRELFEDLSTRGMELGLAYFLHTMDAGVSAVSSFAALRTNVVGFAQFAKAGEQSLYIEPLRHIEYVPCLARIYGWCEASGQEFEEYFSEYVQSGESDIDESYEEALIQFVRELESVNQTPMDWNANYMMKCDFGERRNRVMEIIKLSRRRKEHVEKFELYRKKRG